MSDLGTVGATLGSSRIWAKLVFRKVSWEVLSSGKPPSVNRICVIHLLELSAGVFDPISG